MRVRESVRAWCATPHTLKKPWDQSKACFEECAALKEVALEGGKRRGLNEQPGSNMEVSMILLSCDDVWSSDESIGWFEEERPQTQTGVGCF